MFNVTWLAIIITASPTLAPLIVALHLLLHFLVMGRGQLEILLVAQVTLLGLVIDQLLFIAGIFTLGGPLITPPGMDDVYLACILDNVDARLFCTAVPLFACLFFWGCWGRGFICRWYAF